MALPEEIAVESNGVVTLAKKTYHYRNERGAQCNNANFLLLYSYLLVYFIQ